MLHCIYWLQNYAIAVTPILAYCGEIDVNLLHFNTDEVLFSSDYWPILIPGHLLFYYPEASYYPSLPNVSYFFLGGRGIHTVDPFSVPPR